FWFAVRLLTIAASPFTASIRTVSPNYDLSGVWVKHDRAVLEIFHINVTCVNNCDILHVSGSALPAYTAFYLDGALAGKNTWNASMVGDLMSATGTYNNFADDSGTLDDTNVLLVTYGSTYGTVCGDYDGDSARYYRQSALQ
ncbi:unnamed protein product, partial [Didymodactylos carnosus]